MASRQRFAAQNLTPASTTNTSASPVDFVTLTQTFDNGGDYLVLWGGKAYSSANSTLVECALDFNGTVQNAVEHEMQDVNDRNGIGGVYRFTGDGTSKTIKLVFWSSSGTSVTFDRASMVVIKLGSNDQVTSSTALSTTTATDALKVALTFTALAGDYLFIASGQCSGVDGAFKLTNSGGSTVYNRATFRQEHGSEYFHQHAVRKETLSAGSVTRDLRFGSNAANTIDIREAWLVALYLPDFEANFLDTDGHPDDTLSTGSTTSTTYVDSTAALTFTPAALEHLAFFAQDYDADTGADTAYLKGVLAGTDKIEVNREHDASNAGYARGSLFWPELVTPAAVSQTWKTQVKHSDGAAAAEYFNGTILALQLEAASGTITGTGATVAPAQIAAGEGEATIAGTGQTAAAAQIAAGAGTATIAGTGATVAPAQIAAGVGSVAAPPIIYTDPDADIISLIEFEVFPP